ncbi:hypothetical protein, partial [Aequorivita sp. KMM 9714]|uniref:hypothetical protein n=1 Tax=Aequorivita sp. KMM 9714 TaxID=2707173 RepID=UPI0013EE3066
MKKLLLLLLLCTGSIYAQVGIGTDTPNPSTQLEIKSANRGVLIPQVPLTGKTDQTTINAGNLESLLVYNTSTNETLTPGYYYWFQESWQRLISDADLPDFIVLWDVVNNQFTYIDQNGDIQTIDISDLETLTFLGLNVDGHTLEYTDEDGVVTSIDLEQVIKNFETITTLIKQGDGTYTFTNEAGEVTVIDVIGDVVTNIENQGDIYNEIISIITANTDVFVDNGDGTFTHTAANGDVVTFDANTTAMVDNGDGTYTFTNANGETITVDVIGDVVTNIQNQGDIFNEIISIINANSDVLVDNGDGTFTHTAANGDVVTFDANTTSMVDNGDGTYTFTNANGETITVDVIGDVVTNIQNQGDIYNEIITMLQGEYGNVIYNPTTNKFYYIDENGNQQEIDWSEFNTVNTSFTLVGEMLVITDSDNNTVELSVDEIANNSTFINTLTTNQQFIDEIINLIELNETVTNLVDNGNGTITYTNEDNVSVIIDLSAGPQGPAGEDGKSAYEIALENGFVGTVTEWLESLKGADGADGADGSVVTIVNGNWYIDGVDTGVAAGGQNGQDGLTPEIGTN